MIHVDARFSDAVEAAVTRVEALTDAELVVVAAPRSGSYRDLALLVGITAMFVALLVALYSPWHFDARWIPVDLAVFGGVATWLSHRSPRLMALLAGEARREAQVQEAAYAAFVAEQVHGTRAHTGLLIYASALERSVTLVPDHGLEGRVPPAAWNRIVWDSDSLEGFLEGLEQAGRVLAKHVPALEGDNPDEIPNAPRVRT